MKKTLVLLLVALAVPSVALAAKPTKAPTGKAPIVKYVLTGTLWNYSPASATADGSVTLHVTHANHHNALLKGMDLTFGVTAKTKFALSTKTGLVPKRPVSAIKDGTRGMVVFRGTLKLANSALMTSLTSSTTTALAVFIRTG